MTDEVNRRLAEAAHDDSPRPCDFCGNRRAYVHDFRVLEGFASLCRPCWSASITTPKPTRRPGGKHSPSRTQPLFERKEADDAGTAADFPF